MDNLLLGPRKLADLNFKKLGENPNLGRGLFVGRSEEGDNLVQGFYITGRSEHSQNRVLEYDEKTGRVFTVVADPAKAKDPAIVQGRKSGIYNAMIESVHGGSYISVVGNGSQANAVIENSTLLRKEKLPNEMKKWIYESGPEHTPRITASSLWMDYGHREDPFVQISVLRKSSWSDACDRNLFEIDSIGPGFGYGVNTYLDDGNPLPAFHGEPYLLPILGDNPTMVANNFWWILDSKNMVSLAVKFIPKLEPSKVFIINKYKKVA